MSAVDTLLIFLGGGVFVAGLGAVTFAAALILLIIMIILKKRKLVPIIIMIAGVVLVVGGLVAAAYGYIHAGTTYSAELDTNRASQAIVDENGNIRYKVGEFSYTDDNGNVFDNSTLSQYKYTIVNRWEPWCTPCKAELPELEKVYQNYRDKGINMVGLYSTEKDGASVIAENGLTYPTVLIEESGSAFDLFSTGSVPFTFILDSEGYLVPLDRPEDEIIKDAGENPTDEMRAFYDGVVKSVKTYEYWAEKLDKLIG